MVNVRKVMRSKALRCRQICESDLPAVAALLAEGFPYRDREYWAAGLARLSARKPIESYPRFGYLLESDGAVAGVILTLFSECEIDGIRHIRCNLSSWCVAPELQSYGGLLVASAIRRPDVIYINVSPAPHTRAIIEAQGFKRLYNGLTIAAPMLRRSAAGVQVSLFRPEDEDIADLSQRERVMLKEHAEFGCVALVCRCGDARYPFVFLKAARWNGRISGLHLAYCRRIEDFVRFAGPIARALRQRAWFLSFDADGPTPGLLGWRIKREDKYYKGPVPPRLGDLSYTEDVFFH
jgi:hypothetical protein